MCKIVDKQTESDMERNNNAALAREDGEQVSGKVNKLIKLLCIDAGVNSFKYHCLYIMLNINSLFYTRNYIRITS